MEDAAEASWVAAVRQELSPPVDELSSAVSEARPDSSR